MLFFHKLLKILPLLLSLLFASQKAHAVDADLALKDALYQRITEFNQLLSKYGPVKSLEFLPPKFIKNLAISANTTEKELRKQFDKAPKTASMHMTIDKKNLVLNRDSGVIYALIPTTLSDGKEQRKTKNLALYENGKWYFIFAIEDMKHHPYMLKKYPFVKDIKF